MKAHNMCGKFRRGGTTFTGLYCGAPTRERSSGGCLATGRQDHIHRTLLRGTNPGEKLRRMLSYR